jgi:ketosteroid isomerase-like protein
MTPSFSSSSTEANVQTVRAAIDAFNRGDIDAVTALGGDDFEYDWTRSLAPNRGVYRGLEGLKEFVHEQWDMFDEIRLEPQEFIARGNQVVVPITVHARGRQGIPLSANSAQVYTFDDGRLVRITLFQDRAEALAATGGD